MPLEAVLAAVPELHDAASVEPLAGGLTNVNYKVVSPRGTFVMRISGKDTGLLAIDRENEAHNTRCAAETGVGAPFVAWVPEHDALVLEFLEGEVMTRRSSARATGCLRSRARAAACTEASGSGATSTCSRSSAATSTSCRSAASGFPSDTSSSSHRCARSKRRCACVPEPTVPCNNDLLAENFIDCGGELRLIDYEYSGNNEPSFELGNVWSESNLSLEQLERLVAEYYGAPLVNKVARCRVWGLMSKYGWTLWGSIQDGVSELDFDFWGWAMEKYERAVAEFDDPDFERLLDDVRRQD